MGGFICRANSNAWLRSPRTKHIQPRHLLFFLSRMIIVSHFSGRKITAVLELDHRYGGAGRKGGVELENPGLIACFMISSSYLQAYISFLPLGWGMSSPLSFATSSHRMCGYYHILAENRNHNMAENLQNPLKPKQLSISLEPIIWPERHFGNHNASDTKTVFIHQTVFE